MLKQTTCMIAWSHYFRNYQITSFWTLDQMMLLIIHPGIKFWIKFLSCKLIYRKNYLNTKSLFQSQFDDTNMESIINYITFKGYLYYRTIFCHKVALYVQLMDFFIWRRNALFSRYHRFQNLWCYHRHCYIMEVILMLISYES